jgi:hypothetical protein
MKVPGKAWLQFQVTPRSGEQSLLAQTAFFAPKGMRVKLSGSNSSSRTIYRA